MTQTVKVYQIASELGMDNDAVVQKIRALGIPVSNMMSKVPTDVADRIKSSLQKEKNDEWVEVQLDNGVIKRVRKARPQAAAPAPAPAPTRSEPKSEPAPARVEVVEAPAPVEPARPVVVAEPVVVAAPPPAVEPAAPVAAKAESKPTKTKTKKGAKSDEGDVESTPVETAPAPVAAAPAVAAVAPAVEPAKAAPAKVEPPKTEPAKVEPVSAEPVNPEPAKVEASKPTPAKIEAPAPVEPAKVDPPKSEPLKVEATKIEPAKIEPAKVDPPKAEPAAPVAAPRTTPAPTSAPLPPSAPAAAAPTAPAAAAPATRTEPEVTKTDTTIRERVSTPPPSGISYWDPVTKQVVNVARSVEVEAKRLYNSTTRRTPPNAPGRKPGPGQFGQRPGTLQRDANGKLVPRARPSLPPANQTAAHKRVVKIEGSISLQKLAQQMSVKATDVLLKLMAMGLKKGVNINSTLDATEAALLAEAFGHEVENVEVSIDDAIKALLPVFKDEPADLEDRAPVVTVMGHVDHGKTTLLDAILGMRVADAEAGGITQKVSAYRVNTKKGPVVFFDTPGHEAFTKLRARGAETTDVAVIVVAADDGVMPTTVEAINHVHQADVPIVVALNKIDKPNANPTRVVNQLLEYNVIAEEHGGTVLVVPVSAKQRVGIDELVETLALQSEILELKANPKKPGVGTVFDATLDKGKGVVARMLVQDGTLRAGDVILSGTSFGKIRAMFDDRGKAIQKAGPSTPVEVLGLNEVPSAGDRFYVVSDVKKVQGFVDEQKAKHAKVTPATAASNFDSVLRAHIEGDQAITVGVIIKADAPASVEALSKALTELSTDKVKLQVIHSGIGGITESDVQLAAASKVPSTIIGFNVRPQGKSAQVAEGLKTTIRLYDIIYNAIEDMKLLMVGQLKPTVVEKALGKAEVRQVFTITKVGTIAGCMVTEGKITRSANARLVRDSIEVWKGKLGSLRRFKDDSKEVTQGFECGIGLENYADLKPGDIIEAYELEEVAAQL
ncbi:MAG: translation initiation factor IF-2 [Myxococcales bacterium]|nr:translation initiation factor IF-2 [Myxococcales bacterium]